MLRSIATAAILAATVAATPAAAVTNLTFAFGGTAGDVNSVAVANGVYTLTATSRKFTVAPGTLTDLSQTTASGQISRTTPGIGILGGASGPQVDTNQPGNREAILVSATRTGQPLVTRAVALSGMKLSFVDADDTLQIFGVNGDGSLDKLFDYGNNLTQAITIDNGLNGAAIGLVNAVANNGTSTFGIARSLNYSSFLFTTHVGGDVNFFGLGQGYRIDSVTATVPEPATWALLVTGFGLVGFAARRRTTAVSA